MIDIMYYRLPYVSRGALSLKTPAPLYIYTSIKQYNHLIFDGTPLSNTCKCQDCSLALCTTSLESHVLLALAIYHEFSPLYRFEQ
jgi:hypothetical protein